MRLGRYTKGVHMDTLDAETKRKVSANVYTLLTAVSKVEAYKVKRNAVLAHIRKLRADVTREGTDNGKRG